MKDDEMDRILSRHDEILPSSGFVASVMEEVHREASAPPPIPFPWKRAVPVLVLAAFALVLVIVSGVSMIGRLGQASLPQDVTTLSPALPFFLQTPTGSAVAWTALALLAAFVSVKLSMRLAGGKT